MNPIYHHRNLLLKGFLQTPLLINQPIGKRISMMDISMGIHDFPTLGVSSRFSANSGRMRRPKMAEPPENWGGQVISYGTFCSFTRDNGEPQVSTVSTSVCLVLYTSTQTPKSSAAEPGISGDLIQHGSCHLKHPLDQKKITEF